MNEENLAPKLKPRSILQAEIDELHKKIYELNALNKKLSERVYYFETNTISKQALYRKFNQWAKSLNAEFPITSAMPIETAFAVISNAIWEMKTIQAVDEVAE